MEPIHRKWRFGDRNDGWRIRTLNPMLKLMPYIMPVRSDACNSFRGVAEISAVDRYVQEKRAQGLTNFTVMHVLLAGWLRLVSQRPGLNRFIAGQKIYARKYFEAELCIKKEMKLNSPDTVISMRFPLDATAEQVYRIAEDLIRAAKNDETNFDGLVKVLDYIPGLLKAFTIMFLRFLDYFGLLPMALKKLSPFHGSLFITSMASLGLPPIYHHIYNFGNVPVFIAFGIPEKVNEVKADGSIVSKKTMSYTLVMDERICDGYYYASAFRLFNGIFRDPWQLDSPPEQVFMDLD